MTNQEVCNRWVRYGDAKGSNLRCEGQELISYQTTVGVNDGANIVLSWYRMSNTTAKHLSYASRAAATVGRGVRFVTGFSRGSRIRSIEELKPVAKVTEAGRLADLLVGLPKRLTAIRIQCELAQILEAYDNILWAGGEYALPPIPDKTMIRIAKLKLAGEEPLENLLGAVERYNSLVNK